MTYLQPIQVFWRCVFCFVFLSRWHISTCIIWVDLCSGRLIWSTYQPQWDHLKESWWAGLTENQLYCHYQSIIMNISDPEPKLSPVIPVQLFCRYCSSSGKTETKGIREAGFGLAGFIRCLFYLKVKVLTFYKVDALISLTFCAPTNHSLMRWHVKKKKSLTNCSKLSKCWTNCYAWVVMNIDKLTPLGLTRERQWAKVRVCVGVCVTKETELNMDNHTYSMTHSNLHYVFATSHPICKWVAIYNACVPNIQMHVKTIIKFMTVIKWWWQQCLWGS